MLDHVTAAPAEASCTRPPHAEPLRRRPPGFAAMCRRRPGQRPPRRRWLWRPLEASQQVLKEEDVHDVAEPVVLAPPVEELRARVELLSDLVAHGDAADRVGRWHSQLLQRHPLDAIELVAHVPLDGRELELDAAPAA